MPTPEGHLAVRPARAGMKLVHPSGGRPLPDAGGFWPDDSFTNRRLRDGGVCVYDPDVKAVETGKAGGDPVVPVQDGKAETRSPASSFSAPVPAK